MKPAVRRRWALIWTLWCLLFIPLEWIAVVDPEPGDTLSEMVWAVLGLHSVVYFLVAGFLAWLVIHFLTRGKV